MYGRNFSEVLQCVKLEKKIKIKKINLNDLFCSTEK